LVVARRRRMREGVEAGREERAVVQRRAWARVGGLKEESRVRRVVEGGEELDGGVGRECRILKLFGEEVKEERRAR
jgi:hypothetical protein